MADAKEKRSFFDNFKIHDQQSCERAIKYGGIAAMVSAGLTGIFAIAGYFTSSDHELLGYYLDPWIILDAVFILIVGIYIFRKSRVAATLAVIWFTASKIMELYELERPSGLLMTVVFFVLYANAMRGTYIWHSKYKNAREGTTAQ